jgi:hypothetical protein
MQLILAIDSDPRRSEQLANLVRARLEAELVQATSAGEGLHALRDRVPDLILTSPLLSPFDDGVLDEYLRDLGAAATHVQTVRIPMLSTAPRKKSAANRLFSLGRKKAPQSAATPDGCDPKVFADEIAHYLTRSLEEKSVSAQAAAQKAPQRFVEAFDVAEDRPAVEAAFTRGASAPEEWDAPTRLVEEFQEPAPVVPEPRFEVPEPPFEDRHVPGSILDLRTPIAHRQAPAVVAKPEPPVFVEPEPVIIEPDPVMIVEPAPDMFVESEPLRFIEPEPERFIEPEPQRFMEPEPRRFVEPFDAAQHMPALIEPAPVASVAPDPPVVAPPAAPARSESFEAALAAIRAAWAKPEAKPAAGTTVPAPAPVSPRPRNGSSEVDLTNAVDALDDGGLFDPNQVEFSEIVNKLDEVTEDEATTRRTTYVR